MINKYCLYVLHQVQLDVLLYFIIIEFINKLLLINLNFKENIIMLSQNFSFINIKEKNFIY